MAGISYIRDAQRRQAAKKKPKPVTAATPGVDYIRNNTRDEVTARNAAVKAAQRKTAGTQPTAPQAAVSTPAASPAAPPVAAQKPVKVKKPPKAQAPAALPTSTATEPTSTPIAGIFNSARRELDRQQRITDAQMEARLADQRAFDEYVARVRSASNQTLGDMFSTTAQNAQQARDTSLANAMQYTTHAIQAAGGNADVLNAAGTPAAIGGQMIQGAATAQDSAAAQQAQLMLSQYNQAQQTGDLARSANMRSTFEADRRQSLADIASKRFDLSQTQAKAEIDQANADRQFQLDQALQNYAMQKDAQTYGLDTYNAETTRLGTKTPEERAAERAIEQQRADAAAAKAAATASGKSKTPIKDLNQWYADELKRTGFPSVDAMPDGPSRIDFGRRAVQQLHALDPSMTAEDAMATLRGILPAHVLDEGYSDLPNGGVDPRNRVMYAIATMFRG